MGGCANRRRAARISGLNTTEKTMNKQQARRIALAVEASYILLGAETACITDKLSEADAMRFKEAQQEMA